MPQYVIFHDSTLLETLNQRPANLIELGKISGVGQAKLLRYGEALLQVVGEKKPGSSLGVVATHKNGTRKSCALNPVFADQPPCS